MFVLNLILTTLFLCILSRARAGVATADDTDAAMFYSGLWIPDGDPNTFGNHDTWTNQSGASVSFYFIGTQIQVFATRRPEGTYHTNVSFSIDGGPPTLWLSDDFVPQIMYKNLVYTSGELSPMQHRITMTNSGDIFWLDFVQYETSDVPPATSHAASAPPSTTSVATPPPDTSQQTTTVFQTQNLPTNTSDHSQRTTPGPSSSTVTTQATSLSISAATSSTTGTTPSQTPSSMSIISSGTTSLAPAPTATQSLSSSKVPIIAGVVVGVVGLVALLLALLLAGCWWFYIRRKSRTLDHLTAMPYDAPTFKEPQTPKGQFATSPRVQAPDSWMNFLGAPAASLPSSSSPTYTDRTPRVPQDPHIAADAEADAHTAGLLAKLRADLPPSPHGASAADRPLPYLPSPQMQTAFRDGAPSPLPFTPSTDSEPYSYSYPYSGETAMPSAQTPRTARESRDGGVRLAGGPVRGLGTNVNLFVQAGYDGSDLDAIVERLPPSYAQLRAAGLDADSVE